MTNKNPFEIRLDVLKMAQEMMDKEMHIKELKFNQHVETLREIDIGSVNAYVENNTPQMYSPEDIVAKASSLYGFISDSSSSTVRSYSPSRMSDIEEKYRK